MRKAKITLKQWCIENNRLDLLDSWDYEMNDFTPNDIAPQSHKQAYFKCSQCNRSLPCRIQDKVLGKTNCRYCSNRIIVSGENDFETWCKENSKEYLLHEWDYEKNNILPSETTPYNDAKVWWKCKEGHSWPAIVRTRAKGTGCPYCTNHKLFIGFNDLETWCKQNNREYLLDEWDYEKNTILPSEITAHNEKRVWWKCPLGHSYKSVLNSRTNLVVSNNRGCPECNKS
ncbi:MAG: zinc-ribbon domain-containing protein, partial [Clostridia bacterium]|nr:zinc-ribbon domain-containing protein [Clostridia bacterium]